MDGSSSLLLECVFELVRVPAALDDDLHRAADPGQLAAPRIRDHGDVHGIDAFAHGPPVLQDEAACPSVQGAGHQLERDVGARLLDCGPGGQHLPLARTLQVATELLSRKSLPNGPPAVSSCRCGVAVTSNAPLAIIVVSFRAAPLALFGSSGARATLATISPVRITRPFTRQPPCPDIMAGTSLPVLKKRDRP